MTNHATSFAGEPESTQTHLITAGSRWVWIARLLGAAVGIVLLVAGIAKATDMEMFIRQIRDYGFFSNRALLAVSAWGLIAMECALGVALLVTYRPRVMTPITGGLLFLFLGATGWAWATGVTENCGCFGAWAKRTPAQAAVEDVILIAALAVAWLGTKGATWQSRKKGWTVALAWVVGLALPWVFGFSPSNVAEPQSNPASLTLADLKVQGLDVDLKQGEFLVALIDTDCKHCQESVPQLNELLEVPGVPPLVALCMNEEWQRLYFTQRFQAAFPIGQIGKEDFMRLLSTGETPRLLLVRHQQVKQVWDKTVPTKETILAARRAS